MNPINPSKKHHTKSDGSKCKLIRIKTYSIETIFDFIRNNPNKPTQDENLRWTFKTKDPSGFYIDDEGNKCKLRRAKIFFKIGIDCVKCESKAKFFALEEWPDKNGNQFHFELYAIDSSGEEVLMTIDHTLAKSNEGKDHVSNYQPLCKICNEIKSNH